MSADYALQVFAVGALKAGVHAVAGRVFDRVAPAPTFPYLHVADWQVVRDDADCIAAVEIFFNVHVWSRKPGRIEASAIAESIVAVLHRAEADLPGYGLVFIVHRDTRFLADPDGLTTHGIVNFRAQIDAP